jgi:uncharacterized membrane protein
MVLEHQEIKRPALSKTLWFNVMSAIGAVIVAFAPSTKEYFDAALITMVINFVNVVLRFATKARLKMWD